MADQPVFDIIIVPGIEIFSGDQVDMFKVRSIADDVEEGLNLPVFIPDLDHIILKGPQIHPQAADEFLIIGDRSADGAFKAPKSALLQDPQDPIEGFVIAKSDGIADQSGNVLPPPLVRKRTHRLCNFQQDLQILRLLQRDRACNIAANIHDFSPLLVHGIHCSRKPPGRP